MYGKECFLITAYCDNIEKENVLSDCIDNIKNISSFDVIVHSHYPLSDNIQKKVKSVIYDKSNPILKFPQKAYLFWRKYQNFLISLVANDYGWAALTQWKNSYKYLVQLDYQKIIILNYDVFIDKFLFEQINNDLNYVDGVLFYWHNQINMCLGAFNKVNDIFDDINLDDYLKNTNDIIEAYLSRIIDKSTYTFKKIQHEDYRKHFYTAMDIQSHKRFKDDDLPVGAISEPLVYFNHPYPQSLEDNSLLLCQYHIGTQVINKIDTGLLSFLFYSIRQPININIFIDDNLYYEGKIADNYFYLASDYQYDRFIKNEISIRIIVNDLEINPEYLSKLKENCRIELL